jgi:hypothetical protein
MKIKLLVVKYVDWVVLAILATVCVVVLYQAFIGGDTDVEKVRQDLIRFEKTVKDAMDSDKAPLIEKRNLVQEMADRFEHLPVIPPFRRDPFITFEDIPWPSVLQLAVGQTQDVLLKGTRLTEVMGLPDRGVDAAISYDPDQDVSKVTFTAKQEGNAEIRVQDELEQVYKFQVAVRTKKELPPPNPPAGVTFQPRGPIEIQGVRHPPVVLISFQPNDPIMATPAVGFTNAARIYRKPAEASDLEYLDVSGGLIAQPAQEQIAAMLARFNVQPGTPLEPVPGTGAPAGPVVPEEAPVIGAPGRSAAQITPYAPGSFVFLDRTVDEGESYIYKIITYSTGQDAEPTPTATPFVQLEPVAVPALVEFAATMIMADRAWFRLSRMDPDTGRPLEQTFQAVPGMPIGGIIRIRATIPVDGGPPRRYKFVDFSTNCILVDTITSYPEAQYSVTQDRTGKTQYKVRDRSSSRILYLTPRGFLRMKEKEQPRRR